ncbi:MAG: tol-pal system protein YbgF [Alphaproteobacteria bacterium]
MLRVLVLAVILALPASVMNAQGFGTDAERLERLEKRIMAMEGRAFNGTSGAPTGSAVADLEQRMQELEREGSQVNGGVERLSNAVERLAKKVDEMAKDYDLRLRDLEAGAQAGGTGGGTVVAHGTVPTGVTPMAEVPAAPSTVAEASPTKPAAAAPAATNANASTAIPAEMKAEEHYNKAYAYLTAADYPNAQAWLEEFIKRHPKDALADNAYYWLGEVHLVQNNPKAALMDFKSGLETFPKGQKAPANLLKMGVALSQIGQPDLAKGMWQKLVKDFPKAPEAEKARAKLAELPKAVKK